MTTKTLGQIGYEAYRDAVGGRAYDGSPLPMWPNIQASIQHGWDNAALEVSLATIKNMKALEESTFSAREIEEIQFARMYASTYSHGTDGHIRLMVIAKYSSLFSPLLLRPRE